MRGESGPVALLTKLRYVLTGPIERKGNQSNKHLNIINSHVMRVHCESKPELIDKKIFWNSEKIGTENLKNDVIKNSVESFDKNEFNDNEKFENLFLNHFVKILNLLMEIMRLNCHLLPEMKLLVIIICYQKIE